MIHSPLNRLFPVGFASVAILISQCCFGVFLRAESTNRPNVVVILTDDQGWGDLSLHGNPNLSTPHIDSLARDGASLQNFYVCAVCSPTRAEFLTGRYHTRTGVYSTSQGGERFDLSERTIGDLFTAAGYATAAYGKWHSGMQPPYHPNSRGFGDFYGFCSGHWGNYFSPILEHNNEIVQGNGFVTNDLTDHAIEFIESHRKEPFFVYLPLNTPHSPMQVPDKDWQAFDGKAIVPDPLPENAKRENVQHTRAAMALCENIDGNVGRLLKTLDTVGIAKNTIVVFFCDNGPNGHRFNGGLRGVKGSVYEGGLRSPCMVRWPEKIAGGTTIESVSGAIDLLPTLAELTGVAMGRTAGPLDGVSMAGRLRGEQHEDESRFLFTSWNGKQSVRSQQFRFHFDGTLYDIPNDRSEQVDVARKYPHVAAEHREQLSQWIRETGASRGRPKTPPVFPVGHSSSPATQLPIRDATATGKTIRRSSRHPNSSYFYGWTDREDEIQWNVDVLAAGLFEAELWYACEPSAVGTRLLLGFDAADGEKIEPTEMRVETANPSPIVAAEYDRAPRTEGFEKAWQPMKLGRIRLPTGNGTLRLSAANIAGDRGVEVRLLVLHRLDQ